MILGVYAMRDVHTGFMTPTVEQNDAVAMRNFEHAVLSGGVLATHSADFALCRIGSYNTDDGALIPQPVHVILTGIEVTNRVPNDVR